MSRTVNSREFELKGTEPTAEAIRRMIENQFKIMEYSLIVKPDSHAMKLYRPYLPSSFTNMDAASPTSFAWALDDVKRDAFKTDLVQIFTIESGGPRVMESQIGALLGHIDGVQKTLKVSNVKPLFVTTFGMESSGKSSNTDLLVGHKISLTAVGRATKAPVQIHVYRDATAPNEGEFYFNSRGKNGQPLNETQLHNAMKVHMEQLPTIVGDYLDVAIYSPNPFLEGVILDLPGFRCASGSTGLNQTELYEQRIIFQILENAVENSDEDSIFICNEVFAEIPNYAISSIQLVYDYFKGSGKLNIFENLLKRVQIVVNKGNIVLAPRSGTCCWQRTSNQEEAIHKYFQEYLLKHIDSVAAEFGMVNTLPKPVLAGFNHDNDYSSCGTTVEEFDRNLSKILVENFQRHPIGSQYMNRFNFEGYTALREIVTKKRMKAISKSLSNVKSSLANFYASHCKDYEKFYEVNVCSALDTALSRFLSMLETYSEGVHKEKSKPRVAVAIPKEGQPELVDVLLESPSKGLSLLQTFEQAKYKVYNIPFTDNIELMRKAFNDALNYYGKDVFKKEARRNGINDVEHLNLIISSSLLAFSLDKLDPDRCAIAQRNVAHNKQPDNSPKKSIEYSVYGDYLAIADRILTYLDKTLRWHFEQVVDVTLLLDRVQEKNSPNSPLSILDVDVSALVFRERVLFAFMSWIDEVMESLRLEVTQANCNSVFEDLSNGAMSMAFMSSTKAFDHIANDPVLTASQNPFAAVFKLIDAHSKTVLGNSSDDRNRIMIHTSFGDHPNLEHRFCTTDFEFDVNIDYGQKFFSHLMFNLYLKIHSALTTKIRYFASSDYVSNKTFRSKLNSFVYHEVGQPKLTRINDVADTRYRPMNAYAADKFVVFDPTTDQDDNLKKRYKWNAESCVDTGEARVYDVITQLVRAFPSLDSAMKN